MDLHNYSKKNIKSPTFLLSLISLMAISAGNSNVSLIAAANAATTPSAVAPTSEQRTQSTDVLVFDGTATAYGDGDAIASILESHNTTYRRVSSDELDSMSLDDISQYKLIIWPGGYAGQMSDSLRQSTRENIRQAVNDRGVGYVGICAGAFIAVSADTKNGLGIIKADSLPYYHLEDEGTDDAMVKLDLGNGNSQSLVWWGGPYLPEKLFPNGIISRYSDTNQPAIAQTMSGKGLVILSGPHPEAPQNWRTKLGLEDSDGLDQDLAWKLFNAALKKTLLPVIK